MHIHLPKPNKIVCWADTSVFDLQDHPSVPEGLDLIEEDDQFTHMLTLDDAVNDERMLGEFDGACDQSSANVHKFSSVCEADGTFVSLVSDCLWWLVLPSFFFRYLQGGSGLRGCRGKIQGPEKRWAEKIHFLLQLNRAESCSNDGNRTSGFAMILLNTRHLFLQKFWTRETRTLNREAAAPGRARTPPRTTMVSEPEGSYLVAMDKKWSETSTNRSCGYCSVFDSTFPVAEDEEEANPGVIVDQTETNLVALRRTIYLTLQSSLDFEEAAHKVMKLQLKPGQEVRRFGTDPATSCCHVACLQQMNLLERNLTRQLTDTLFSGGTMQHGARLLRAAENLREILRAARAEVLHDRQEVHRCEIVEIQCFERPFVEAKMLEPQLFIRFQLCPLYLVVSN